MCGSLMSPAHETQSMREIRLLRGRLLRKGGGLTGMTFDPMKVLSPWISKSHSSLLILILKVAIDATGP